MSSSEFWGEDKSGQRYVCQRNQFARIQKCPAAHLFWRAGLLIGVHPILPVVIRRQDFKYLP
jgi:hypothetical protein